MQPTVGDVLVDAPDFGPTELETAACTDQAAVRACDDATAAARWGTSDSIPHHTSDHPTACECVACAARAAAEGQYVDYAFGRARRLPRTAESIADALGYCARHAALLGSHGAHAESIGQALHAAYVRWHGWLSEPVTFGERVFELFFSAGRDCPACRYAERSAARTTTRLGHALAAGPDRSAHKRLSQLCFAHFKTLYIGASTTARERLLVHYRESLTQALARHLDAAAGSPPADSDLLLHLVAGSFNRRQNDEADAAWPLLSPRAIGLAERLADRSTCAACGAEEMAHARWVRDMRLTLHTGQPDWLSYPSCPEHVRAAVALDDPVLARGAARFAAEAALSAMERRAPPFSPPLPEAVAKGSRWLRRRRARQRAPKKETTKKRALGCAGCERRAVARDAAIGGLLDLLRTETNRDTYAGGYGLCLRHFAPAYLLADRQTIRPLLLQVQLERLARMTADLAAATAQDRASSCVSDQILRRALARLNGAAMPHDEAGDR